MQDLPPTGTTERLLLQAVRDLIRGRSNAVGTVTLTPSVTSTTVKWPIGNMNAKVFLSPETANASSLAGVRAAMTDAETITITHPSSAATDLRFGFVVIGG